MQSLLDHTPDLTSNELKTALEQARGVSVSRRTIDRACIRADYSCKQVSQKP
jgi:transcriptional/translational regulatory protein YebC/TACO1